MKLPKYRIPLLTAWSLIGYAKKDGDSYAYDLNVTEISQAIRGGVEYIPAKKGNI